jgi:membrane associated rhomboid family serine protease/Zn-finger nucleic acid-binding protein
MTEARRCPRCTFSLRPWPMGLVEVDACPRCHGTFVEPHEGAHLFGAFDDVTTWGARGGARSLGEGRLRCPKDQHRLEVWRVELPGGSRVEVDTCPTCRGLWLDASEGLRLQQAAERLATLGPPPRRVTTAEGFHEGALNAPPPGQEKTGVGWYLFQLFTAMPLEVHHPKKRAAVVCLGLIIACVVAFVVEVVAIAGGDEGFIRRYGAVGADLIRGYNLQAVFTHMFLHGGIAHLAGNMWMLWTFGDNIEDRVGRHRFFALYLGSGLVALLLQMLLTTDLSMPLVGASGAIAGLMGAYLGLFPRAKLYQVAFFIRWTVPAWFYVGGWALLNVLIGVAELNRTVPESNVAWWAHVGGFVVGLSWALLRGRSRYGDGVVAAT